MDKDELRQCLAREAEIWSSKDYGTLLEELASAVSYERGEGSDWYAVDVELLEREPDYVHVMVVVDDKLRRPPLLPYRPLSADFLVYRDGRVDK